CACGRNYCGHLPPHIGGVSVRNNLERPTARPERTKCPVAGGRGRVARPRPRVGYPRVARPRSTSNSTVTSSRSLSAPKNPVYGVMPNAVCATEAVPRKRAALASVTSSRSGIVRPRYVTLPSTALSATRVEVNVADPAPRIFDMVFSMSARSLAVSGLAPPVPSRTASDPRSSSAVTHAEARSSPTITDAVQRVTSISRSCPARAARPARPVLIATRPAAGPSWYVPASTVMRFNVKRAGQDCPHPGPTQRLTVLTETPSCRAAASIVRPSRHSTPAIQSANDAAESSTPTAEEADAAEAPEAAEAGAGSAAPTKAAPAPGPGVLNRAPGPAAPLSAFSRDDSAFSPAGVPSWDRSTSTSTWSG